MMILLIEHGDAKNYVQLPMGTVRFGSTSSHLVATPAEAWQDDASFIKAWSGDRWE